MRYVMPLLLIAVLTYVAIRLVSWASNKLEARLDDKSDDDDRRQRLRTLLRVARNTLNVAIVVVAVLIALGTIGVAIGPALTTLGVAGLALSLGAQTLIKDMIGGMTILLEDQYRVGDSIRVGTVTGDVERITLRSTEVRDSEGRLFVLSNGDIRTVANETREWARALVELHFAYTTDLNAAVAVLNRAMAAVAEDPAVKPHLLSAPEVLGWNQFDNWSVVVRLRATVAPGRQGEVARTMRREALGALHAAGIAVESQSKMSVFMAESPPPA